RLPASGSFRCYGLSSIRSNSLRQRTTHSAAFSAELQKGETMKYVTAAFAFMLAACLPGASDYDLSGTWAIEYHDDNGHEVDHPKLVLHQEGQKLNSDGSSGLVHAQA